MLHNNAANVTTLRILSYPFCGIPTFPITSNYQHPGSHVVPLSAVAQKA